MAGEAKLKLVDSIIREFVVASNLEPRANGRGFSILLNLGNGEFINATDELKALLREVSAHCWSDNPVSRKSLRFSEFYNIVEISFANELKELSRRELFDEDLNALFERASRRVAEAVEKLRIDHTLILGCWLIDDPTAYPLRIGPITFRERLDWLAIERNEARLSHVTARRVERAWRGGQLKARKSARDSHRESAILEAIGETPLVCEVSTRGLSSAFGVEKAVNAARVAITAVSLLWESPERAIERMGLLFDGGFRFRRYAARYGQKGFGSGSQSINVFQRGHFVTEPVQPLIKSRQSHLDVIGEAIFSYVDSRKKIDRPKVANPLFLALWWFHEAQLADSDQLAVTYYCASLDALAGGKGKDGIAKLLNATFGFERDGCLMKDGRTTNQVLRSIYSLDRSQMLHGNSKDFFEDWSDRRETAHQLAALTVTEIASRIADESITEIDELRRSNKQ